MLTKTVTQWKRLGRERKTKMSNPQTAFWKATWLQIASTWRKWKCKKYGSLAVGHAHSNLPSIVHAWWQHARCLPDRRSQRTGLFLCDSSPPPGQRWPKSMFSFSSALPTISQTRLGQQALHSLRSRCHCSYNYHAGHAGSAAILLLPSTLQHVALLHCTHHYSTYSDL